MMVSHTTYVAVLLPVGILAAIGCALLWRSIFKDEQ